MRRPKKFKTNIGKSNFRSKYKSTPMSSEKGQKSRMKRISSASKMSIGSSKRKWRPFSIIPNVDRDRKNAAKQYYSTIAHKNKETDLFDEIQNKHKEHNEIDSVLMKNLSKYIEIIKDFGINISSLRSLHSTEEIDEFLINYMKVHVSQLSNRLSDLEV